MPGNEARQTVDASSDDRPLVYTPKDIGRLLGLSKNSVTALLRSKQLRSIRYGRKWLIPRSALDEFLQ